MKKLSIILGLCCVLSTATASAANLETRTYTDGEMYLPITFSNVAWDSIEKVPNDPDEIEKMFDVDMGEGWKQLLRSTEYINGCKFRWSGSGNGSDNVYIGAAAPCTVTFADGGIPTIEKLTPAPDEESAQRYIGSTGYISEEIPYSENLTLDEGLYFVNNYLEAALGAQGYVYWYDYILNVKNPNSITNADAYVMLITKSMNYPSEEDYENKTNGTETSFKQLLAFTNQVPVIIEGRTLVPMRDIFEALDCGIEWNALNQTVTATDKNNNVIEMTIGKNVIKKNGEEISLDVPPQIINDSTMVPVRAVSESLDLPVEWNDAEKIVSIIKQTY